MFPSSGLLLAACMELTQEQRVLKLARDGHSLVFTGQYSNVAFFYGQTKVAKNLHSLTTSGGKTLFHYLCFYIYNIQIFLYYFARLKRQDTVYKHR
jgi:hypothetical protein